MLSKAAIARRLRTLPTISATVTQLAKILDDPRSNASDFERVIRPDPALTANLLLVANSAFFNLRQEVRSVNHAIALLGTRKLYDIALSAWFSQVIPVQIPGYDLEAEEFWRHSLAVATLAENFAKRLGGIEKDLPFTAGLLHDVGKLVAGLFLVDELEAWRALSRDVRLTQLEAEKKFLGVDHAELGKEVTELWNLPAAISMVTRYHHEPQNAGSVLFRLNAVVHLSDVIAHELGFGTGSDAPVLAEGIADRLGLNRRVIEEVAKEVREILDDDDPMT